MKIEALKDSELWFLGRGDQVVAIVTLEAGGVGVGTVGVVFEEGDGSYGPLVRWENGGVCNVHPGEVGKVPAYDGGRPTLTDALKAMADDYTDLTSSDCGCCEAKREFYKKLKPWQLPEPEERSDVPDHAPIGHDPNEKL